MDSGVSLQSMPDVQGVRKYAGIYASEEAKKQEARQEFLVLFYKELLKQAFKPSKLGMDAEESANIFGADMLIEKLASELAQNRSFSEPFKP